jgi:hypothetical protein
MARLLNRCFSEYYSLIWIWEARLLRASVLSSLYAFEVRYDLPVVFAPSTSAAACQIERWAFYFARQMVEDLNDLWRGTTPQPTNDSSLG